MKKSSFTSFKGAMLAASTMMTVTGLAQAADLDQILYASPVEQDVIKPVEIGSGWYLRGDIAFVPSDKLKARLQGYEWLGTERFSTKSEAAYSGGVGYQFTDTIRGDVTVGYRNMQLSGEPVKAGIWDVMANAYYDIGNYSGVTPYIGAGLGLATVDYKFNGEAGDYFSGRDTTRFQWALMAGAAIDITENIKFDLGYRYARISSGAMADIGPIVIDDKGLESHQFRAGLRFTTW